MENINVIVSIIKVSFSIVGMMKKITKFSWRYAVKIGISRSREKLAVEPVRVTSSVQFQTQTSTRRKNLKFSVHF